MAIASIMPQASKGMRFGEFTFAAWKIYHSKAHCLQHRHRSLRDSYLPEPLSEGRLHLKNAYRVILTRARQGMIIFVPKGAEEDATRPPAYYDQTYEFLKKCGLRDWA